MTDTATMYCHNIHCESFNQEQEFRWAGATFHDPAEWIDDPECRDCTHECHDYRLDSREILNELSEAAGTEAAETGANPDDLFLQLVAQWVQEQQVA